MDDVATLEAEAAVTKSQLARFVDNLGELFGKGWAKKIVSPEL